MGIASTYCSFCGKDEAAVKQLIWGGGQQATRDLAPVSICDECVALALAVLAETESRARAEAEAVPLPHWHAFVLDGVAFEWSTLPVKMDGQPRLILNVRRRGKEAGGAVVYGPEAVLGYTDAVAAVRALGI
jgi:hypothetical protein